VRAAGPVVNHGPEARSQLQTVWRYTGVTAVYICERPLAYLLAHEIKYTIVFVETQDFYRHQSRTRPTVEPSTDRHAAVVRGLYITVRVSFCDPLNTQPLAFLFPMCGLVTVPTLSAQCACLTARFMPWWAFCALAYPAAVSSSRSAQLWPCATWVAAATLTCAPFSACTRQVSTAIVVSYRSRAAMGVPNGRGVGGNGVQFERAAGGEGCSEQCHAARCASRVGCGVDFSGMFAAAWVATPVSRVVQHARGVLNCTPGACNFTSLGRVTPCTPRILGAWLGRAWQKRTSFLMRSWDASPPIIIGAVPCHRRYFFRARCLTAPLRVHKQGARRYEAWGPFFRRVPTNNVLDAMMRGRHLCGMGTATATCCHQPGRTQRGSSTRASMRTLNGMHRAPATTRPTAVMEGAPAASYAPPEREGRPMRHGWRRRPLTGRWSSRRRRRPRGHDRKMILWPSGLALCAVRWVGLRAVGRPVEARRADVPWCCKVSMRQSGRGQESVSHAAVSSMFSDIFVVLWTIRIARVLGTLNRLSSKCQNMGATLGAWEGRANVGGLQKGVIRRASPTQKGRDAHPYRWGASGLSTICLIVLAREEL